MSMKNQTKQQRGHMIRSFLKMWKWSEFDAMDARRRMNDVWGIDLDHHCFGEELEAMTVYGQAIRDGNSDRGLAKYIIS